MWYPGDTAWREYYFAKNLQGDVLAIYNSSHTCVASYSYDAWGNIISKSGVLADVNPFRYRSYYYDAETWFYYLQSRYYDPQICRFINADAFTSTGQGLLGNNMFAYCGNNPIILIDTIGESATIAGGILGGFWGLIAAFTDEEDEDDQETTIQDIVSCILLGASTGAAAGFVADMSVATCGVGTAAFACSAIAGGIFGGINSAGSQYILDESIDGYKVAYDFCLGALMGGTCTAMGTNPIAPLGSLKDAYTFVNAMTSAEMYMFTSQSYIGAGLAFDIAATTVTSFGAWLASGAYSYYK